MNKLESLWHFDRCLIMANYAISEYTIEHQRQWDYHVPPHPVLDCTSMWTMPLGMITTALLIAINIAKLPFEILAKTAASITSACGSTKARKWKQELDVSFTVKKIACFTACFLTYTLAESIFFGMFGAFGFSSLNSRLTERLGQSMTFSYLNKKIAESKDQNMLEITYQDIVKASQKIMPRSLPPTLCAFGYAAKDIHAFAKKHHFKVIEYHKNDEGVEKECFSRKYTGLYFPTNSTLCSCGTADKMYDHLKALWKGEKKLSSPVFDRHRWVLVKQST